MKRVEALERARCRASVTGGRFAACAGGRAGVEQGRRRTQNLARTPQLPMLNSFQMNRLFFGDNLGWLRDPKEFPDASVDLVYLDPPFNSNADYNVLFREASGAASQAQFHAFTDTRTWADAA